MAAANLDLLEGQFSDGCGQVHRDGAEADADRSVRLLDMVDGEPGDRRGPLGIEEQQRAGKAVFGLESVVVQQATGGVPAGFDVHRLGGAVPSDGREAEIAGYLLGEGPSHEVACLQAKTDVVAGHPALKVGLSTGCKGQVLAREPVQEIDGRPQMLPRDLELVVSDVLAAAATAKPSQEVPSRVPVRDFPSLGRRMGGDEVLHMPFEADHLLVPFRQCAGSDEDAADVFDDLAFRELVQGLVGEGSAAGAEIGQDGGDDALESQRIAVPARSVLARASWRACSFGAMEPVSSARSSWSRCLRVQRGQGPEARSRSACPQVGQGRQSSGSGAVQGPQVGASAVPEWMPRSRPQTVQ
ncbi:hypothetical protein [Streptantibioticus ferralitis]|uniref:Uncharacterized protein n=1 Tax=Streptantibioticus ferralitis TaxID=236510 RepID=A0ABT5Z8T9_9ACTN|nr:hypothetical protein [Streptantibioticus ferralitis]MDF2260242.1 hypothetical protein [Streptantibioticus ferralitis]